MLIYPHINPVALALGPIKIHWYGLMYVVGFFLAWGLGLYRARKPRSGWTEEQVGDLVFYGAMGAVIGGRIGYMLFYDLSGFLADPLLIFKVWQGGMSFHGGLIGATLAAWFYGLKSKKSFSEVADFLAPLVPLGLGAGRIGNFINGELWGRVTTMPWGMIYPNAGPLPRHPSELYEFLLEGILLFTIVWIYSAKPRPRFAVASVFLIFYGCFRIIGECFRQPDIQLGYIAFNWLTMGQLLSMPVILWGLGGLIWAYYKHDTRFNNIPRSFSNG